MSDADDHTAASVSTNRLTCHDAAHLAGIVGDGKTLRAGAVRLDTGDGWVRIDAVDGGVEVTRIDAPEGDR